MKCYANSLDKHKVNARRGYAPSTQKEKELERLLVNLLLTAEPEQSSLWLHMVWNADDAECALADRHNHFAGLFRFREAFARGERLSPEHFDPLRLQELEMLVNFSIGQELPCAWYQVEAESFHERAALLARWEGTQP